MSNLLMYVLGPYKDGCLNQPKFERVKGFLTDRGPKKTLILLGQVKKWHNNFGIPTYEVLVISYQTSKRPTH
jgi:hypothetical protein